MTTATIIDIGAATARHDRRRAAAERIARAYESESAAGALVALAQALEADTQDLPASEDYAAQRDSLARVRGALRWEAQFVAMLEASAEALTMVTGSRYRGWEYGEDLVRNVMAGVPETRPDVERRLARRLERQSKLLGLELRAEQIDLIAAAVAAHWAGVTTP